MAIVFRLNLELKNLNLKLTCEESCQYENSIDEEVITYCNGKIYRTNKIFSTSQQ